MIKFLDDFKAARRVSIPIVAIETADPAATIRQIASVESKDVPLISWDISGGLKAIEGNNGGRQALKTILGERDATGLTNPSEMLNKMSGLPGKTGSRGGAILFMHNAHRFLGGENTSQAAVGQAIWNLRDQFKTNERTLVLIGPGMQLPAELREDVVVLTDPLPGPEDLKILTTELWEAAGIQKKASDKVLDQAVEATRGLSTFAAEQVIAMSLRKDGLDLEQLWERKRKMVEQTPGLAIYRGTETFNDVRGVERIKEYLTKLFGGEEDPTVLVFMDEIEKMFAGIAGDLSGTSQEQHGEFLRWTQDYKIPGLILVGHPGCSKSFICKACAGQFNTQMVELNMTALKGSLVGQTGQQTRAALKTISAIGRPLIMATSNSLAILPPELRRRFKLGTFFFDLPTADEREAVWDLYTKKYKLNSKRPDDKNWTPSDIESCCNLAWRLKCSLEEASAYLVPIAVSTPDKIEELRIAASGKFLSSSYPGVYSYDKAESDKKVVKAVRSIRTPEDIGSA